MKINLLEEFRKNTLISHIILGGLSREVAREIGEEGKTKNGTICDVVLTINGREIDLQPFIEHWQTGVRHEISNCAKEIVDNKFMDLDDMVSNLHERVKSEIDKRMEDWENEDEMENKRT